MTFITDSKLYDRDRIRNTWPQFSVAGVLSRDMLTEHPDVPELWPAVRTLLSLPHGLEPEQCPVLRDNDLFLVFADDMAELKRKMADLTSHPEAKGYVFAFDHGVEADLYA